MLRWQDKILLHWGVICFMWSKSMFIEAHGYLQDMTPFRLAKHLFWSKVDWHAVKELQHWCTTSWEQIPSIRGDAGITTIQAFESGEKKCFCNVFFSYFWFGDCLTLVWLSLNRAKQLFCLTSSFVFFTRTRLSSLFEWACGTDWSVGISCYLTNLM